MPLHAGSWTSRFASEAKASGHEQCYACSMNHDCEVSFADMSICKVDDNNDMARYSWSTALRTTLQGRP